jgi:hypothetical protein
MRYDSITATDTTYVSDSIAVVETVVDQNNVVFFVFEVKEAEVYLTNYSPSFTVLDFHTESDVIDRILVATGSAL